MIMIQRGDRPRQGHKQTGIKNIGRGTERKKRVSFDAHSVVPLWSPCAVHHVA